MIRLFAELHALDDVLDGKTYKTPDGIHWSLMQEKPVITNGAFADSANLAFWDPSIGQYRAYWRTFTAGVTEKDNWKPAGYRAIRTATSADFLHWDNEQLI